jgi:competence protein ComEA
MDIQLLILGETDMEIFKKTLLAFCLLIPTLLFAETVNINTADKESLVTAIKGVGEKRAEAIIAYREQHGPFKSIDELAEVRGIGTSIVEKNTDNLSITDK